MSITVADCLKLPSLREGIVIAGRGGLHHIVNNISVLEITSKELLSHMRTEDEPINNFEICLTSFAGIADDVDAQCRLIQYLSDIGDVCLVVYYIGIVVREIHPDVIATADRLNFSLVIMPPGRTEFRYSEVIRDVCDLLFKDRAAGYNFHNTLALTLSKLPENRRSLNNLLRIASDTAKATLLLSDVSHLSSLLSPWPTSNPITQAEILDMFRTASGGKPIEENEGESSEDEMVVAEYLGHVVHIFRIRFLSYKLRHYFLYLLDEAGKLTLQDVRQITGLIQLLSELWNLDEDEIDNSSLIHAILSDNRETILALSQKHNFDLTKVNMLISVHSVPSAGSIREKISEKLELQRRLKDFSKKNSHHILFNTYDDYFILFVKLDKEPESGENFVRELHEQISGFRCSVTLMQADLHEVRDMFCLYEQCCRQAENIFPKKPFLTYSDMLFANSCSHIFKADNPEKRIFDAAIEKLQTLQDAESVMDTLTAYYLDADCRITETAQSMYLHRNTVKYRLNKAHGLLHTHFGNSVDLYFMQMLAGYYRLLSTEPSPAD